MRAINNDDVLILENQPHTLPQLKQYIMIPYIHYPPITHQLLVCKLPSNKYIIILEAMPALSLNMMIVVLCIIANAMASSSNVIVIEAHPRSYIDVLISKMMPVGKMGLSNVTPNARHV